MKRTYSKKGWKKQNLELPIFFIAGDEDPVIGNLQKWINAYEFLEKEIGYQNMSHKLYKGKRHELLNEDIKENILKTLKNYQQKNKITILYFTYNSNDSLYSDNIVILGNKKSLISGSKEEVYKDEKIFKKANIELPFIINLSKKLQFYNLIEEDYQDSEKMVDVLWK